MVAADIDVSKALWDVPMAEDPVYRFEGVIYPLVDELHEGIMSTRYGCGCC